MLSRVPLHEIPEGLAEYLEGLPGPAEYDDIGLIAFSPSQLEAADHPTVLVGGTTPVEEVTHLESVSDKVIDDAWTTLDDMKGNVVRI